MSTGRSIPSNRVLLSLTQQFCWLVVCLPLWKMMDESSIGIMKFPTWWESHSKFHFSSHHQPVSGWFPKSKIPIIPGESSLAGSMWYTQENPNRPSWRSVMSVIGSWNMFGGMQRICFGCKILCILYIYSWGCSLVHTHNQLGDGGYLRYPPPLDPPDYFFINPLDLHIHARN